MYIYYMWIMSNFCLHQRIAKIGYHILIWNFTLISRLVYCRIIGVCGGPVFVALCPGIYIPISLYLIIFFNTCVFIKILLITLPTRLCPHELGKFWPSNDSTLLVCTMCVNIFGVMFLLLHTQQLLRGFKIYLFHLQNRNWRKKRMNTNREEVVVHWFRHGLRLHDNPSLIDGLSECDRFYPVFIFDGEVAGNLLFFFEKSVEVHL